jgi:hypothetical protein
LIWMTWSPRQLLRKLILRRVPIKFPNTGIEIREVVVVLQVNTQVMIDEGEEAVVGEKDLVGTGGAEAETVGIDRVAVAAVQTVERKVGMNVEEADRVIVTNNTLKL